MPKLRPRFTYANVVATLCLFLVLGGGAYAALRPPKNSVGSVQIKPGGVKTSDIAAGAVTSSRVADGSIRAADLAVAPPPDTGGTPTTVITRFVNYDGTVQCHEGEQLIGGGGFTREHRDADVVGNWFYSEPVLSNGAEPTAVTAFANGWHYGFPAINTPERTYALCARWGTGPQGPPGPPGPAGQVADQMCPQNKFVEGFSNGQIVCGTPVTP